MESTPEIKPVTLYPPKDWFLDEGRFLDGGSASYTPTQVDTTKIKPLPIAVAVDVLPNGSGCLWDKHTKYPKKEWPFKEGVKAINHIKRTTICLANIFSSRPIRYVLPLFFILSTKQKRKVIDTVVKNYFAMAGQLLQGYYWKIERCCTMVQELYRVGMKMAGENEEYKSMIMILCGIFQFDNAYRYYVQDAFGIFDRELFLINPAKELNRMMDIIVSRNVGHLETKIDKLKILVSVMMKVKSIREPIVEFMTQLDVEKVRLDEGDWYQCLPWVGHDFGGKSYESRMARRAEIDADPELPFIEERIVQWKKDNVQREVVSAS